MYFIALVVPTVLAIDRQVMANRGLTAYTNDIYKQSVIIASAIRAKQVVGVDRATYCKTLRNRLTLGLDATIAKTVTDLVDTLIEDLIVALDEVATQKECVPMMYRLYRKDKETFFVTRMR